jgi:tetratricopeptide (TPR) repeat protein
MTSGAASRAQHPARNQSQDPASELARLEQAIRKNPRDIDALLRAGALMQRVGRTDEASKLLTQAAALAPERPETTVALAEFLRANAVHDEAVELLQQAIEKTPAVPALWHAIAKTVLDLADLDKACTFFDEALRLDPKFHRCRLERATLQLRRGKLAEALADYDALRQIAANDPGILVGWGDVKTAQGERAEARIAFTAALGLVRDRAPIVDRLERLAIMEFARDLPRADLPPAATSADAATKPDRLAIAFFHVDLPGTASPFEKPDYRAMLVQAVAIARRRAPDAHIVLLTDERTEPPSGLQVDRVIRGPVDGSRLMFDRMRMERNFLASGEATGGVVFLDSDVAINRSPAEIFDGSFDVALTWRTNPSDAPFNGGVALYRAGPAALRFYDHLIATHGALENYPAVKARFPEGMARWWGHQLAMAATVGWTEFGRRTSDRIAVDGTAVRFLSSEDYNFAMDPALPPPQGLDKRYFIHFKGSRKAGLGAYAEAVLGKPSAPAIAATPKPEPADARLSTYDLGVAPITYDIGWFLALAKNRGVAHIDIVPGAHDGFRDDAWCQKADTDEKNFRLWNIILPACQLAGMTVTMHRDRARAAATVYKMRPLIDEGLKGDVFRATGHARRWVTQWLAARGLQRPVVINLRESQFPARNSNMAAWQRFAEETNAVVIPDTDGSTSFGHVFDGLSMDRRLALYEAAEIVMGANNGPLVLCWLSRAIPYLTFKMVADYAACTPEFFQRQGLPVGSQFPWAGPLQRLVWADDDYATIRAAYDAFLKAAGKR